MWGADAGELLALAARLEGRADEIDRAQRALTGRLRSAPWQGPGADRYRQRWESADRRQVMAAAGFLRDAARELRANAAQQQQASAGGSGSTGGTSAATSRGPSTTTQQSIGALGILGLIAASPSLLEFSVRGLEFGGRIWDTIEFGEGIKKYWKWNDFRHLHGMGSVTVGQVFRQMGRGGYLKNLKSLGFLGPALTAVDIAWNWNQHGLYSAQTYQAIGSGAVGIGLGITLGAAPAAAWGVGTAIGDVICELTPVDEELSKRMFNVLKGDQEFTAPERSKEWWTNASEAEVDAEVQAAIERSRKANEFNEKIQKPWKFIPGLG